MCVFDIILKLKIKKFQKVPGMKKSLKEVKEKLIELGLGFKPID